MIYIQCTVTIGKLDTIFQYAISNVLQTSHSYYYLYYVSTFIILDNIPTTYISINIHPGNWALPCWACTVQSSSTMLRAFNCFPSSRATVTSSEYLIRRFLVLGSYYLYSKVRFFKFLQILEYAVSKSAPNVCGHTNSNCVEMSWVGAVTIVDA